MVYYRYYGRINNTFYTPNTNPTCGADASTAGTDTSTRGTAIYAVSTG
jgi:hypothetical protein